ncbi:hypothetical protein AMJ49_02055 [Parcubacteria bacterium DG_74_2]|nr:MAG: hypothetical protein AMJ49_02055 [Parcubacteria bacterium DG_74_2]
MHIKFFGTIFIFLFLFFFALSAQSTNSLDVAINEIAWMGNKDAWYFEWIELYNITNQEIDLSDWKIENAGTKNKSLEISVGKISPKGFFLICKSKIENCDFKNWNLSLNDNYKENGKLVLRDNQMKIVDETPEVLDSDWPAGDKETKQTMERVNSQTSGTRFDNWKTSQIPGGTSKNKNTAIGGKLSEEEHLIYPSSIFINEILPSPAGPDTEEWIEIFNQNDFEVDVSNWKIDDTVGKTKIYIFPKETKILAQGFLVLKREITKITLNNEGDGLNFIQPDGEIIDQIFYEKALEGKSYNRTESGWVWSPNLTPGSPNVIPNQISETKEAELSLSEKKELATISQQFPQSLITFLIALGIAIFSGIIILILKRKIIKKNKI